MQFTTVGERDPFLLVELRQGEHIFAESGAMVSMETTLDLSAEIRGGVLGSLARKFVAGESLFTQKIEATRGDGQVLLSPLMTGDIELLDVEPNRSYLLNDGAFVAAETGVDLKMKMQNISTALFGGTGGFVIVEAKGSGKLAISGFGSLFCITVTPNKDLIIDNHHVIAWDSALDYKVSLSTSQSKGFLRNAVNSAISGEGIVTRFSGSGKVYICSRNLSAFAEHLAGMKEMAAARNTSQNNAQNTQNAANQSASAGSALGTMAGMLRGKL